MMTAGVWYGFDFQTADAISAVFVIASVAEQSILSLRCTMDCFVAPLLAMTAGHNFAIARRNSPELC